MRSHHSRSRPAPLPLTRAAPRTVVPRWLTLIIALLVLCQCAPAGKVAIATRMAPASTPAALALMEASPRLGVNHAPAAPSAVIATSTPTPAATPRPVAPALQVQLSARAAFAVDLTHLVELYAANADTPLPPASTTKIVSALVALRFLPLETKVTVQPQDLVDPAIYSHMGLETGDVVTARDLLVGMLLPSGDDAALALARATGERLPAADGADLGPGPDVHEDRGAEHVQRRGVEQR